MQRKTILKQINAMQKSLDDLEKGRWPTNPPSRLKDTPADRERPIETPPDAPKKPPYSPMEDAKEAIGKAEGDTAPATQSTRAFAESAARRNKASEDRRMKEIPPQPVTTTRPADDYPVNDETGPGTAQLSEREAKAMYDPYGNDDEKSMDKDIKRKPPYKMEYSDKDVELDLKGDAIDKDEDSYRNREGIPQHVKTAAKSKAEIARGDAKRVMGTRVPTGRPVDPNIDAMRKSIEKSLLKLMQYGGA